MTSETVSGEALPEADGEFIQEVEDDLDLDYSGVGTYADALRAGRGDLQQRAGSCGFAMGAKLVQFLFP